MPYSAILFDLDGTLVDSIALWMQAYRSTLQDAGIDLTEEEFLEKIYSKNRHYRDVLADHGLSNDPEEFRAVRDAAYIELLKQEVQWLPYAEAALKEIQSLYSVGMVTGSFQSYVDAIHSRLGVMHHFETTVVCDETRGRGKPDPYPLLLAAEKMSVDPANCLYIGDQQFDVDAANAAGMTICLIPEKFTPNGANTKADIVLETINDLPKALKC